MKKTLLFLTALMISVTMFSQTLIPAGLTTIDVADLNATDTFRVSTDFGVASLINLQITFDDVDSVGAIVNVYSKNSKSTQYAAFSHPDLPWTVSDTIETKPFSQSPCLADDLFFVITKGTMTTGSVLFDNRIRNY